MESSLSGRGQDINAAVPGSRQRRENHLSFAQEIRGGRETLIWYDAPPAAPDIKRGGPEGKDESWRRGRGIRRRVGYKQGGRGWASKGAILEGEWTGEPDLPFVTEETLKAVAHDAETRTIDIDGIPREIRTYGENAVILLDWNDPRILTFGEGSCNIVLDEGKFMLPIRTRDHYKEITIAGASYLVKLGVPTQELMLDGRGHQCFIGGKAITVPLAGQLHSVSLAGKPPNVNIGPVRNTEFLAGKIQLMINETKVVDLFLDAKPQRFNIDDKPYVIQFVDALRSVTINNIRFPVKFGGFPLGISVRGYRRFLRFSSLPQGINPGHVLIRGMEPEGQKISTLTDSTDLDVIVKRTMTPNRRSNSLEMTQHRPQLHGQHPHGTQRQGPPNGPPPQVHDPGAMVFGAHAAIPALSGAMTLTCMESQMNQPKGLDAPVILENMSHSPPNASPGSCMTSQLPSNLNKLSQPLPTMPLDINTLFDNLTRTGLIYAKTHDKGNDKKEELEKKKGDDKEREEAELISFESMFNIEHLRRRRKWVIESLYRGMQCSSCGVRYPPEQTMQYSHHLDWHFHENRRQRQSTKTANTRGLYFSVDDWLLYEEMNKDVEKSVSSIFECERMDEAVQAEDAEQPSVTVSSDLTLGMCPCCHETFSQIFHQEAEEWRYNNAIQVDGVNFHPECHQDMLRGEATEDKKEQENDGEKNKGEDRAEKNNDKQQGKVLKKRLRGYQWKLSDRS